jgi:hypothetical protein
MKSFFVPFHHPRQSASFAVLVLVGLMSIAPHGFALPRSPFPPLPIVGTQLFKERFNGPYWARETNAVVAWAGVGYLVESGSGYALERRGKAV